MDHLDRQLQSSPAPQVTQTGVRAPRARASAYPPAAPDWQICWWNRVVRGMARLYAATCVRELSLCFQAPLPPGPKIIALNHANVTDAFLLPAIFPDVICFLAQANLFDLPVAGRLLAWSGQLPVVRGQPEALMAAAGRHLRRGYSIVICPEGRLNHGGPLYRGGIGAVRLGLQSGFPIVPVGFYVAERHAHVLRATVDGRATHGRWQFGGACQVEIGQAWWPRHCEPGSPALDERKLGLERRLTDELMQRIETLVGQAAARAGL